MNEQEKIEHLMRPRYKLITDYPGNGRPIDFIWTMDKKDSEGWYTTTGYLQETFFTMYPDIFKKLSWWEERTPEEMPEYVKPLNPEEYHHQFGNVVLKVDKKTSGLHQFHATNLFQLATMHWSKWLPATEAEYLSYNQQPQH